MKLDSVIFCEDIRNEINNKHTLVGIYTDRIILQADKPVEAVKFPALSRLSCYFRFLKEDSDSSVDTFEIKFMLPVPCVELPVVSGALKINLDYKYFTITIVGESIPVQPGNIGYFNFFWTNRFAGSCVGTGPEPFFIHLCHHIQRSLFSFGISLW